MNERAQKMKLLTVASEDNSLYLVHQAGDIFASNSADFESSTGLKFVPGIGSFEHFVFPAASTPDLNQTYIGSVARSWYSAVWKSIKDPDSINGCKYSTRPCSGFPGNSSDMRFPNMYAGPHQIKIGDNRTSKDKNRINMLNSPPLRSSPDPLYGFWTRLKFA